MSFYDDDFDMDGNGIPDYLESEDNYNDYYDQNGDGVPDYDQNDSSYKFDQNNDGIPDYDQNDKYTSFDRNGDGVPDYNPLDKDALANYEDTFNRDFDDDEALSREADYDSNSIWQSAGEVKDAFPPNSPFAPLDTESLSEELRSGKLRSLNPKHDPLNKDREVNKDPFAFYGEDDDDDPDEFINKEEYEEKTYTKEDFKSFIKDRSKKSATKKCVFIGVLFLWIILYSLQGIFQLNSGNISMDKTINPIVLLYNGFVYQPVGLLLAMFVTLVLSAGIWLMIVGKIKPSQEGDGFVLSKNKTYGGAKFADDDEVADAMWFEDTANPEGIILGYNEKTDKAVTVNRDKRNENVIVFGSSGAGKSYSFARPNILRCISSGVSFVATDPSGELFRDTSKLATKKGMNVKVLNFKDFKTSNGWNCFASLNGEDCITKVDNFCSTLFANTTDKNAKSDAFFAESEQSLLKALVLYVAISPNFKGEEYERHIGTVYDMVMKITGNDNGDYTIPEMNELPPEDPAFTPWRGFLGAGNNKANFATGLAARLKVFANAQICETLSHDEVSLRAPGREPCAYYVISSVTEHTYKFLLSLFFSMLFSELITEAEGKITNKLDIPVYCILDEFAAIGELNDFPDKVANVRKYGVSISMILQNVGQLKEIYHTNEAVNSILSNCDTWLVLAVNDEDTAKRISVRAGEATIENESRRVDKPTLVKYYVPMQQALSQADGKRMLMTMHEVLTTKSVMIIARGKNIYRAVRYGYPLHKYAKYIDVPEHKVLTKNYLPLWRENEDYTYAKPRIFQYRVSAHKQSPADDGRGNRDNRSYAQKPISTNARPPSKNTESVYKKIQKERDKKNEGNEKANGVSAGDLFGTGSDADYDLSQDESDF